MLLARIAGAALALGFLACRPEPAWTPESVPLYPELSLTVAVTPTEARVGDTIRIVARARNERNERVTLTFGATCFLDAHVFTRAGTRVTIQECLIPMETQVDLEPQQEIVRRLDIPGRFWPDVRPGVYQVVARLGIPPRVRYSAPVELRLHK